MRWRVALLVLSSGCVSGPRALSAAQLETCATRSYVGAFDEVFDATALSLERLGFSLDTVDARQGTLVAQRRDGRGYAVTIESREDERRVVALPIPERDVWVLDGDDGETARWDALEERTRELLASWREHPEWEYAAARELLGVLTFRARLPRAWEHVESSVSRRVVLVQRSKPRRGLNPTLVFEVSRRTPVTDERAFLLGAAEVALGAKGRLTWPDEVALPSGGTSAGGRVKVLDGSVARPVTWHVWHEATAAWTVRIAALCGPFEGDETCEEEWRTLTQSIGSPGFEGPRVRPRTK